MKKFYLTEEESCKHYERVEKIIQRARSPKNNSCYAFHFGERDFMFRHGFETKSPAVCICFKSGEELFFFNNNTKGTNLQSTVFEDLWIFVDLKRNNFYIIWDQEFLEVSFLSILYNTEETPKANQFSLGFYCNENSCVPLYDSEFAQSVFDLSSYYFADFISLSDAKNQPIQENGGEKHEFF